MSLRGIVEAHPVKLICLAALIPVLCFLLFGYFGDDYSFHVTSWLGIEQGWRSGIFAPAWLAGANFSLGEPRFYFYPPLSMATGALLLTLLPGRVVPAVFTFIVVMGSGLAMLKLARHLSPFHAGISALLYCTNFYLIINIVMRYAIAEAVVAAILPLLVLYFVRLLASEDIVPDGRLAVLLACTWLTNIPASLVVFYVMLFTAVVYSLVTRRVRPALAYVTAQGLAVALSSWYLLPVMLARKQLTPNGLNGKFHWIDYTLFHHPQNPLARALTYPLWSWSLAGAMLIAWWALRKSSVELVDARRTSGLRLVALLSCLPLLFEFSQSGLLWNYLPELQLVAFSFRFLSFLAVGLSLIVPLLFRNKLVQGIAYGFWFLWMCIPIAERTGRELVHGRPETFAALKSELALGFRGYEEYLPVGISKPPEQTAYKAVADAGEGCRFELLEWNPQDRLIATDGLKQCTYTLGIFYFPEWHARIDGKTLAALSRRSDGRTEIAVPPGSHTVKVTFDRPLGPLLMGILISLSSAGFLWSRSRSRVIRTS